MQNHCKSKIKAIQFGLYSPALIKQTASLQIYNPETLEHGLPKEYGLVDPRMGTTDRDLLCTTCVLPANDCQGHHGYIDLCKPMFHIGYLNRIKKILECICFYCGTLRVKKDFKDIPKKNKLNTLWNVSKLKLVCSDTNGCGNKMPTIRKEGLNIVAFMKGEECVEGKVILNGEKVYNLFKKISDKDIEALGLDPVLARPENLLITTLLVTPPATRPSIIMDSSLRGEDDLTHKYADIIKSNANLKKYENEGAPSHIIRDYEQLLQFHVATLIDNDISGQPQALQKSGRPLKSISARLKGKEGRLRGNLMGKRVDFSARTVISSDPNISVNEVGIPLKIAMIHTYAVTVNMFNIHELTKLVKNGPTIYPGANYVERNDKQKIDLRYHKNMNLQVGYIVERHLQDGDVILFNRQPSLHKMSMMAHKVRVMKGLTFRLNLSVTSPYNADFDGDEMNLHCPQSLVAIAELEQLALVSRQVVSPQSNKPVMGIVQDTLLGVLKFTRDDTFIRERDYFQLIYASQLNTAVDNNVQGTYIQGNEKKHSIAKPTIRRPIRLYTGKQIFSYILPKTLNFHTYCNAEQPVFIQDGILHYGNIDKRTVGASQGGLIHVLFNDYGHLQCIQFIDALQRLVMYYITHIASFSIGIGDTVPSINLKRIITDTLIDSELKVNEYINTYYTGKLERQPGLTVTGTFESLISVALNKARNVSGTSVQNDLSINNSLKLMVNAGSKGSLINISQMTSCVGQQTVEGKRIPYGFCDRTLPHFYKFCVSSDTRGFVRNSYLTGLNPQEFFFHSMGGREGLIDTAVKTAETGYIQRRLIKALEDCKVSWDMSVRNGSGNVLAFCYGDDGFDGSFVEMQRISTGDGSTMNERYPVPVNVARIIWNAKRQYSRIENDFNASYDTIIEKNDTIIEKNDTIIENKQSTAREFRQSTAKECMQYGHDTECTASEDSIYRARAEIIEYAKNVNPIPYSGNLFNRLIQAYFNKSLRISSYALDHVKTLIKKQYLRALVTPSEMVGTLAAQSVGEPATQMTLNTFHFAGVASTVTMGVPRLKEIINVAKNLKTPSMKIELIPEYSTLIGAKSIQKGLEYKTLRDITLNYGIFHEPDPSFATIPDDRQFVTAYYALPDEENLDLNTLSPFVIRIALDRAQMIGSGLSISMVCDKITKLNFHVIASDENERNLVIRIRSRFRGESEIEVNHVMEKIWDLRVSGVPCIGKVFLIEEYNAGGVEEDVRYTLQTEGTNMREILSLEHVIHSNLYSNNILEIYDVLGIEASREVVLRELRKVIENEGYVNYRHLSLLSDVMTMRGYLTGITRHGVNRGDHSALMRCSFEETVEILLEAAVNGELASVNGVTESIMVGQEAPLGTGTCELFLDIEMLKDVVPIAKEVEFDFFKATTDVVEGAWSPVGESGFSPVTGTYDDSNSNYTMASPEYTMNMSGYNALGLGTTTYNATSPGYSPGGLGMSINSPGYTPQSPSYSPVSPSYSPTSPSYNPTSPTYNPSITGYTPLSPRYSPVSPSYSPTSPAYTPNVSPNTPINRSIYGSRTYETGYTQGSSTYKPMGSNYEQPTTEYDPASPDFSEIMNAEGVYDPAGHVYDPLSPNYEYEQKKKDEQKKK